MHIPQRTASECCKMHSRFSQRGLLLKPSCIGNQAGPALLHQQVLQVKCSASILYHGLQHRCSLLALRALRAVCHNSSVQALIATRARQRARKSSLCQRRPEPCCRGVQRARSCRAQRVAAAALRRVDAVRRFQVRHSSFMILHMISFVTP